MTSKNQPVKISFHVPADEQYVAQLIQDVCDATGQTPSGWVYSTILRRLQDVGLLNQHKQIVQSSYKTLLETLPPGAKRRKH